MNPHQVRLKEKSLRIAALRNGGIGVLIGSVFLVLRWNKARKNEKTWTKFKKEWFEYFGRYPAFLAIFTILYKTLMKIGRELGGYRGLNKKGQRSFYRKLCITITAFFCGYFAQIISPIFSWNWALYALLRSLLSIFRLLIPSDLSPIPSDIYFIIHGLLPWLITYNVSYLPSSYLNFFKSCLDEKREPYQYQYEHNHGILPNCSNVIHLFDKSCLKTHFKDGWYRFKICFIFYLKFYLLTSLLSPIKFIKSLSISTIKKLLQSTLRSSSFLFFSFHFPSRIHCLYKYLLTNYHYYFDKNYKYSVIPCNQIFIMLIISAIFGKYCLQFELSQSKQTDIALFSVWRLIEQYIRKISNLQTYDKDDKHYILGNKQLPALLFSISFALTIFVQLTDKSKLKNLERAIISFFLA